MDPSALLAALAAAQQQNAPAAPPVAGSPTGLQLMLMQSLLQSQVQQAAVASSRAPAAATPAEPAAPAAPAATAAPAMPAEVQAMVQEAVRAEMQKQRPAVHGSLARDEKFVSRTKPVAKPEVPELQPKNETETKKFLKESGQSGYLPPKPKVAAKPKEESEAEAASGSKDKPKGRNLHWCAPADQNPPNKNKTGNGKLLRICSMDWGEEGTEVLEFYARIVPKDESALASAPKPTPRPKRPKVEAKKEADGSEFPEEDDQEEAPPPPPPPPPPPLHEHPDYKGRVPEPKGPPPKDPKLVYATIGIRLVILLFIFVLCNPYSVLEVLPPKYQGTSQSEAFLYLFTLLPTILMRF